MYGWRGRIGLMTVANNITCEQELARLCPEGVATIVTRIDFKPTLEGLHALRDGVEHAARLLASEQLSDLILFGCTIGSMVKGPDYDLEIVGLIERAAKTPAITVITAVKEALRELGLRRLAVATPYTADICRLERDVMTQMGFDIVDLRSCHEHLDPAALRNEMIGRLNPGDTYRLVRSLNLEHADGVFISCTNFRSIEVIQALEDDLRLPVLSSNLASMWLALRRLGVREAIPGYGRLLREHC